MVTVKQGYKTTEFWLAMIAQLSGLFTLLTGLDVSASAEGAVRATGAAVVAISALAYGIARGLTKKGALTGVQIKNSVL